jgi:hypothetical protein
MSSPFAGRGLAVDLPTRIPILDPGTGQVMRVVIEKDGEKKTYEAYVEVFSLDSRKSGAIQSELAKKRSERRGVSTQEESDAEQADILACLTTGWCIVTFDGDVLEVPCTLENARDLYILPEWCFLRDQVRAGAANRANFIRRRAQKI